MRVLPCLLLFLPIGGPLAQTTFPQRLEQLMKGQRDSLNLDESAWMHAVQFDQRGWDVFNQHERKSLDHGRVSLARFSPLTRQDIVEVREDHTVALLREKQGRRIHLASLDSAGTPIEGFLLHDRFGYLYEKTHRAHSFDTPIHFNPQQNAFEFYQLTYGYEPIPTLESPTQDPIYYQSFHQVAVDEEGRIVLLLSETTGQRMFNRTRDPLVVHEVAFLELSLFTVSQGGEPRDAMWDPTFITHGDMESHDSITVHLAFEVPWADRFFFLEPAEGITITDVAQRHENVMTFPGDGSTCTLQQWKRHQSPWTPLHLEEGVFQTRRLKPSEDQQFPKHTPEELRTAFTTECLWPGAPPIEELSPMEPHPDDTRIVLDRIVLRVRYDGPSGPGEKHLLLMMPSGC